MAKFIKVDGVPEVRRKQYNNLKADWQEFMDMGVKVAKIDMAQYNYKSLLTGYQVMMKSIRRHGFPIDIMKRGEEIFLVRRDM